mgnify:FL=1
MSADDPDLNGDDLRTWRRHVLMMQDAHQKGLEEMNKRLTCIEIKLGVIQGKAAAYGTVAGLVVSVAVGIIWKLLVR